MSSQSPSRPPSSSSNAWMWILGCGCGVVAVGGLTVVLLIFGGAWYVSRSVQTDPAEVEAIAHELLPFETPEGVVGRFGLSMMGVKMAFFSENPDMQDGLGIAIIGAPSSLMKPEELRQQMQQELEKKRGDQVKVAGSQRQEVFTLRGDPVQATAQVVENADGQRVVQYVMTLVPEDRAVVLMLIAPEDELDHAAVQRFLDTVE